jgi:hypothetical protein
MIRRRRDPSASALPKALHTKKVAIERSIKKLSLVRTLNSNEAFSVQKKIDAAIERFEALARREGVEVGGEIGQRLWKEARLARESAERNYSAHLQEQLHEARVRERESKPQPGTYEHELALMKGGYRRDPRLSARDKTHAWEVWSLGEPGFGDEPMFVAAFKDKGQAETRIRSLKRSHPHARYTLRRRLSAARQQFGSRSHRRYVARRWKD